MNKPTTKPTDMRTDQPMEKPMDKPMSAHAERPICLRTKGLTKVFGFGRHKTVAVDHVDLELYEGDVISIVGESGSGKTTLAKILLGLINETEG